MRLLALFGICCVAPLHAVDLPPLVTNGPVWLAGKAPAHLAGRPVVLFVFARDCGNCHRSHAAVNRLHAKFGDRVAFIGIHTPEFAWEKDPRKLLRYTAQNGIRYPIYLDNEMEIWHALNNRYWPAMYVFDATGKHQTTLIGEIHIGDETAVKVEVLLRSLMQGAK
ncbi:MAG: redoxin family protein [Turneriella sp.]